MAPRRRKIFTRIVVPLFFVALLSGGYFFFFYDRDVTFVRYPAFGIEIPTDYSIHGIDVSHHNQKINWSLVKQMQVASIRLSFSFIKATEGIAMVDDMFYRNWKKTKEAGIVRGAYHYFIPYKDGKVQAENFIATVELEKGDLPPVLDVEMIAGTSAVELQRNVKAWLQTVEAFYKVKPIIYSNVDFYTRYLGDDFNIYPFWAAHYGTNKQPRINRQWNIWQHSESGRVDGIATAVDFNAFNGDSVAFRKMLVK